MRDTTQSPSRFLGYVQLQVGSRVFSLPVQAAPMKGAEGSPAKSGFFTEDSGKFGILVDSDASEKDVQEQIQRASADAVRHISKKFLN